VFVAIVTGPGSCLSIESIDEEVLYE
jgi:hypothetical protein